MTRFTARWVLVGLCGCGSSGGSNPPTIDAPAINVPAMVKLSGVASARGLTGTTPLAGVLVAAYRNSDESTVVTSMTTDATGAYALEIPTNGVPLDGFLKATIATYVDAYLYPPAPVVADYAGAPLNMLQPATFTLLSDTLCRATQDTSMGAIALEVMDHSMVTIGGATVSSTPAAAKQCYDSGGVPSSTATATDTDGIAYLFNVTGQTTVSASKTGATLPSHPVNAHPGAITYTVIQSP